jgi:hypothetical protein
MYLIYIYKRGNPKEYYSGLAVTKDITPRLTHDVQYATRMDYKTAQIIAQYCADYYQGYTGVKIIHESEI